MHPRFKTIALIGRFADPLVAEAMQALATHATGRGIAVLVDAASPIGAGEGVVPLPEAELAGRAELLVAVGGDGTLLHAARLAAGREVPLLGINRGRLGFLADISSTEMFDRFGDVLEGRYSRDVRHGLRARLVDPALPERTIEALNDVVLQKRDTGRMLDFETWIDGRFVNAHGGDGFVVATATGSTAYALSCGGPILTPNLEALVLAPVSPHTLSDRPIVVSRQSVVEIRLAAQAPVRAQVTCDGSILGDLPPDGRLIVEPSAATVTLLHPPGYDYFRILRSKLHWGRGARRGQRDG
ncbi:MAG TPA: NAD(+)/NADH kinase [Steroidobacteraceae bacterium]|nr:NAD(+)/NADH kinase [Steroidobacteraceae bacterium]